ncbi:MAG: gamma-glutamylcyclotransferase [Pseudomonadota bacterium]
MPILESLSAKDRKVLAERKQQFLQNIDWDQDMWVFGYGSLMWNPEFPHAQQQRARIAGWKRSYCLYSHRYRGTLEAPGLVLGLEAGSYCDGVVLRLQKTHMKDIIAYLWDREMITGGYKPTWTEAKTIETSVKCLTFCINDNHPQYAKGLGFTEKLGLIRGAVGERGPNRDYAIATYHKLGEMGLHCDEVIAIAEALLAEEAL